MYFIGISKFYQSVLVICYSDMNNGLQEKLGDTHLRLETYDCHSLSRFQKPYRMHSSSFFLKIPLYLLHFKYSLCYVVLQVEIETPDRKKLQMKYNKWMNPGDYVILKP